MEKLDLDRINKDDVYPVSSMSDTDYQFVTDAGLHIAIQFYEESRFGGLTGYWLGLANLDDKPSFNDDKVRCTIESILEEFFRLNSTFLLYLCNYSDNRQETRNRLFRKWFNAYKGKERYFLYSKKAKVGGTQSYVSLVVPLDNELASGMICFFDDIVNLFQSQKP